MKKLLPFLFFTFCIFQIQLFGKVKNAVVFGEHAQKINTLENRTLRIFMDMNGDFYPENIIANNELKTAGNSQLAVWSKNYPIKFNEIAAAYQLVSTSYSKTNYMILQDSIRQTIIRTINKLGKVRQTWIVHGFRKKIANEQIDNLTSTYENDVCRNRINQYLDSDTNQLVIEVYWDGKYLLTGGAKQMLQLGYLFKNKAIPNAQNSGYALRRIFSGISCQRINFISHSAGVHVLTSLLFNVKRNYSLPTPTQADIRVVITAAATSGKKHFNRYDKRNTSLDFKSKDNYTIFNLINENDFVLLKKLGRLHFTKRLGNTSLGCNYKGESNKLKIYYQKKFPNSIYIEGYVKNSKSHWFQSYISSAAFDEVLEFLYH